MYRLDSRGSNSLWNKKRGQGCGTNSYIYFVHGNFLTLHVTVGFPSTSSLLAALILWVQRNCILVFVFWEWEHSQLVSSDHEKERREEGKASFFSGNTAFRVHLSFDVGLNTVFSTQINFICLLFNIYFILLMGLQVTKFSMQEIDTQVVFKSLPSFSLRLSQIPTIRGCSTLGKLCSFNKHRISGLLVLKTFHKISLKHSVWQCHFGWVLKHNLQYIGLLQC